MRSRRAAAWRTAAAHRRTRWWCFSVWVAGVEVHLPHERYVTALLWTAGGGLEHGRCGRAGSRLRPETREVTVQPRWSATAVEPRRGFRVVPRTIPDGPAGRSSPGRRAGRIPLPVGQRPYPAVAGQRGAFDVPVDHPGIGGPTNQACRIRHGRDLPYLSLPSGDGRPRVRLACGPLPWAGFPGSGNRRTAQRAGRHYTVRALPRT